MAPDDRDAVVLARALGWTSDRIAAQLRHDARRTSGRASPAGCERCCLRAIAQPQLLQHVPHVRLDRGLADHQPLGDLAVAQALRRAARAPRARAATGRRPAARRPRAATTTGSPESTASTSSPGGMSLSRYPAAPTRRAARTSSASSETVSISTRTPGTRARIAAHASTPPTSGIPTSSSATSGSRRTASSTASRPPRGQPDDLDPRVGGQQRRRPLAHQAVIVGDEHAHRR